MENGPQHNNFLNAAKASHCWIARVDTVRTSWLYQNWPYPASALLPGSLPQTRRDPSLGVGPASAPRQGEQELR